VLTSPPGVVRKDQSLLPGDRTLRLPGGIVITVVALAATVNTLRAAAEASIYMLFGETYSAPPIPTGQRTSTGPGFYVGISSVLRRDLRAGVSLRQWATQRERLEPTLAILIARPGRPLHPDLLHLVETHLIRRLWLAFTLLNTVSGCPTAARRLNRHQVAFGLWLTQKLIDVVRGRLLQGVTGTPTGGTLHEQIVRLVRARGPMLTTEIVSMAPAAGIPLFHHGDPCATVRKDASTREKDSRGPTRVRQTRVTVNGHRTGLFYPPTMSRAHAIRTWKQRTNQPVRPLRKHSRTDMRR
jgi:hypothetical protein